MTQQPGPRKEPAQTVADLKTGLGALRAKINSDPTLTPDQKTAYTKHIDSLMSLG